MLSVREECNIVVFQREEQSHLFCGGGHLSFREHMVMGIHNVSKIEKSVKRLGAIYPMWLCGVSWKLILRRPVDFLKLPRLVRR